MTKELDSSDYSTLAEILLQVKTHCPYLLDMLDLSDAYIEELRQKCEREASPTL